jgi:hypothetical protein
MYSKEQLLKYFDYRGGQLYLKPAPSGLRDRRLPLGTLSSQGYIQVMFKGKTYGVHRLIYQLHYGNLKDTDIVDHINTIRHDNRIENLRRVTHSENSLNTYRHKDTRFKDCNITLAQNTWIVYIGRGKNQDKVIVGYFDSREKALQGYLDFIEKNKKA